MKISEFFETVCSRYGITKSLCGTKDTTRTTFGEDAPYEGNTPINEAALRWYWMTPKRQGVGTSDFLYSYRVPTSQNMLAEDAAPQHPSAEFLHLQSEGKLTYSQYIALVRSVWSREAFQSVDNDEFVDQMTYDAGGPDTANAMGAAGFSGQAP